MRILLVCFAVLPLSTPAALAQVVHGRVLDASTEAPIAAAVVSIRTGGAERTTNADSLGRFVLAAPRDTAFRVHRKYTTVMAIQITSAPGTHMITPPRRWSSSGERGRGAAPPRTRCTVGVARR
jgi:hypothetical protein